MKQLLMIASLTTVLGTMAPVQQPAAQVAGGTTTVGVTVTQSTELALGWSVKKTVLGKAVYNETGTRIGKVEDLIISPERNVSYLIIGAGGFVGLGRHDVAVAASAVQNQSGKLVMTGATKDSIKALPTFDYTNDTAKRDAFIASAEAQLGKGRENVALLQKKAATATSDAKAQLEKQGEALQTDVKAAEQRLDTMKHASAKRWKEFEADVTAALTRLRKSLDKSMS